MLDIPFNSVLIFIGLTNNKKVTHIVLYYLLSSTKSCNNCLFVCLSVEVFKDLQFYMRT